MPPTVLVACDPATDDGSSVAFARTVARAAGRRHLGGDGRSHGGPRGRRGRRRPRPPRRRPELRALHAASAAAGLQRVISDERPLLTVVGSARGAVYGRTRVGSTVDRVLNGAARAVAVVPRGYWRMRCARSAVGLLPSAEGLRALRGAAELARAAGVPLVVLAILRRSPDAADAAAFAARLAPGLAAEPRCLGGREPARGHRRRGASERRDGADVRDRAGWTARRRAAPARRRARGRAPARVGAGRPLGARLARLRTPGRGAARGTARRVLAHARSPVLLVPRA